MIVAASLSRANWSSSMIVITEFLHASLLVADLARRGLLRGRAGPGAERGPPRAGIRRVWYEIGGSRSTCSSCQSRPGRRPPEHGGRDRHIALGVTDLEQVKRALQQAGYPAP